VLQHIFTACGGTQKGIALKELLCGLVLLTRGREDEKIKCKTGEVSPEIAYQAAQPPKIENFSEILRVETFFCQPMCVFFSLFFLGGRGVGCKNNAEL